MRRFSARTQTAIILGIALLSAALTLLLPENPYQRWQLLDGTIHRRARWMYERIHFDPRPIDVVFVGPSRIGAGINAPLIGEELAARGLPANAVNFSFPEAGRNLNTVIIEELLKTKRPKLVVIGVVEKPSRFGHSAFKYLAPARDVLDPGYPGNLNYLSDLAYLPYRKMELFAADLFPQAMGLTKRFDPARYPGPSIDTTAWVPLENNQVADGSIPGDPANIERGVRKLQAGMHPPLLPRNPDLEFGDERHNVREIVRLAKANGAQVAFVALPYYSSFQPVQEENFYAQFGPVWNAGFMATNRDLFWDYGHLTSGGARQLSSWLTPRIATLLEPEK